MLDNFGKRPENSCQSDTVNKCLQSPDGYPAWAFSFARTMSDPLHLPPATTRTVRERRVIQADSIRFWSTDRDGIDARFERCMYDMPTVKSEARRRAEALFEAP